MALEDLIERVEITRSRIESQLTGASVINVASARADDGASALATVLAHSFARAGYPTLLLEGRGVPPQPQFASTSLVEGDVLSKVRLARQGGPDALRLDALGARSVAETKRAYAMLRDRYAISVSSHSLAKNPGMIGLASLADVVLISFRKGRSPRDEDRVLAELLRGSSAPVLGVVMMEPDSIESATELHDSSPLTIPGQEPSLTRKRLSARTGQARTG
jgi:hypothetical protein